MTPATLLALVYAYRYPILVPLAFIAGFPVGMIGGVAIRLGYLLFLPAYVCLMAGELIGDVLWYCIGYFWERVSCGVSGNMSDSIKSMSNRQRNFS